MDAATYEENGTAVPGTAARSDNVHARRIFARIGIYLAGLVLLATGIVLQTASGLGVAALTCFATAAALAANVSLGTMVAATYIIYVGVQAWICRHHFRPKMLLELVFSVAMGVLVDGLTSILAVALSTFLERFLIMCAGLAGTAVGVAMVVGMDIVPNAPDGLVQAIAKSVGKRFGSVKVVFDSAHVAASLILSWACLGSLAGFGLTTVISALFLGRIINLVDRLVGRLLHEVAFGPAEAQG